MEIILAKTAGFCFGVQRAIDIVNDNLFKDYKIYTKGPIIHNENVVNDLKNKGVEVINELCEIKDENSKLIIRTHGVSKKVYDELNEKNIDYIDATCPFVKKIHRIVLDSINEGYQIVIVGDKNHPEVLGINGWCDNSAVIIENIDEAKKMLKPNNKYCIVAQTTINIEVWQEILNFVKNNFTDAKIFDTICSTTNDRQKEAEEIARVVDIMLVIGGKESSNTKKLAQVCKKYCNNTYHIEDDKGLLNISFSKNQKIGITAGASTPASIIKEVILKMNEEKILNEETNVEESFAEAFEKSLITLNTGDIVSGTVIGITPTEVFVNLGYKMDGNIPLGELSNEPISSPDQLVKIGDTIEVFVVRVNDVEGNILLSKKKIESMKGYQIVKNAFENGDILKGKIIEIVNGGVIAISNGVRVFVPASLASDKFLNDLGVLLNEEVSFKLIDMNERKRKVVGSVKAVLQQEKKALSDSFWSGIEIGKSIKGTVKSLTNFGAFVDVGGVDGLVHISELSWGKIKHPSEVINVGDVIEVYILDFDKEKNKVSLGYKKKEDNPWEKAKEKYNLGDVIKCKIVRIVPFGAFAEIEKGIDGLIHISQISQKRINKPSDVLSVGDEVEAKIVELDLEKQKINLSIKELLKEEQDNQTENIESEATLETELKEVE